MVTIQAGDGFLDLEGEDAEPLIDEAWICNAVDGAAGEDGEDGEDGLTAFAEVTEYDGPQCAHSGLKVVSGHDTNGLEGLQDEADEETETEADDVVVSYLCSPAPGLNSLIETEVIEAAVDGPCSLGGGIKLTTGLDTDANGSLADEPNLIERNICNGQPGQDGAAGIDGLDGLTALVVSTPLVPGEQCPYGGHTVLTGLDSNDDETLDELDQPAPVSSVLCNGAPGAAGYSGVKCRYGFT